MCPISVTDTSIHLIRKYASAELQGLSAAAHAVRRPRHAVEGHAVHDREGRRLRRRRASRRWRATTAARWRLYGEKWFCSHTDADVALLLARPEGAPAGTRGLALFAMPRRLKDGTRNAYRIVRLKDKLGTRSMASGEIRLEGAVAYPVGEARPRPQADDGAGQPVAPVARRARGGDDAPLRQRGAGCGAPPRGVRQDHHRVSAAAPPAA